MLYEYSAKIIKAIDGDTCDVVIDLGFNVATMQRIRLSKINAPEIKEHPEKAEESKKFLASFAGQTLLLKSQKKDKYGRWLGEFFDDNGSINEKMIELGLAEKYK